MHTVNISISTTDNKINHFTLFMLPLNRRRRQQQQQQQQITVRPIGAQLDELTQKKKKTKKLSERNVIK